MEKLTVLFKSDNMTDIEELIVPYVLNAKTQGWWDAVTLIIWGPSQKKVAEEKFVGDAVRKMIKAGIDVYACKKCSDSLGLTSKLESLGITVIYTGTLLSERLREEKVLTL